MLPIAVLESLGLAVLSLRHIDHPKSIRSVCFVLMSFSLIGVSSSSAISHPMMSPILLMMMRQCCNVELLSLLIPLRDGFGNLAVKI